MKWKCEVTGRTRAITTQDNHLIAVVGVGIEGHPFTREEQIAHAHLVAAAPELLEKLADLLNACDNQTRTRQSEILRAMEQARTVIVEVMGG